MSTKRRASREELADWICCGLDNVAKTTTAEVTDFERHVYEIVSNDVLGLAWIGKVGNAVKAYKLLNLEAVSNGEKVIRRLTIRDLSRRLDIPVELAERLERMRDLHKLSVRHIAHRLREGML